MAAGARPKVVQVVIVGASSCDELAARARRGGERTACAALPPDAETWYPFCVFLDLRSRR